VAQKVSIFGKISKRDQFLLATPELIDRTLKNFIKKFVKLNCIVVEVAQVNNISTDE
jgi:hypothetical protein